MNLQYEGYQILLDRDLDDEMNEFEMQSKGCLLGIILKIADGSQFRINFYDPIRLKQDAEDELKTDPYFYEENVVLIEEVTKENVLAAIQGIFSVGAYQKMYPFASIEGLDARK